MGLRDGHVDNLGAGGGEFLAGDEAGGGECRGGEEGEEGGLWRKHIWI